MQQAVVSGYVNRSFAQLGDGFIKNYFGGTGSIGFGYAIHLIPFYESTIEAFGVPISRKGNTDGRYAYWQSFLVGSGNLDGFGAPETYGGVAQQVAVVEIPAQRTFFVLAGCCNPGSRFDARHGVSHAKPAFSFVIKGIHQLTVEVRRRAFGLSFVKPAVPRVHKNSHRQLFDGDHLFGNAIADVESATITAM